MSVSFATARDVKRANRRLYDAVAGDYETIDGRRDAQLEEWVRAKLAQLARRHGRGCLIDLGAGSGVVTRAAAGLFDRTIALDLSPRILAASGPIADEKLAADTDALPLADESVNVVTCFAVLHHLFDCGALVEEVSRVLKPGGAFWSDHDMDATFYRRFHWPLRVYRRMRAADEKYTQPGSGIDASTYALAEFRENGVDGERVIGQFRGARLDAAARYHWFGLTPLTNRVFGRRHRSRGWAPLLSIVATKPFEGRA